MVFAINILDRLTVLKTFTLTTNKVKEEYFHNINLNRHQILKENLNLEGHVF